MARARWRALNGCRSARKRPKERKHLQAQALLQAALRLLLVFSLPASLTGCYVVQQGFHQNSLLNQTKPLYLVLQDSRLSPQERSRLLQSRQILTFARRYGLQVGRSYSRYLAQPKRPISYLVSAAEPLALRRKVWSFPLVGKVPYLGFFAKADRDAKAKQLSAQGWDVHKGAAAAYSSLGYFSEPLLGSMLRRDSVSLAHLLFHELVHRTIWLRAGIDVNEALAEFIAEELTRSYFSVYLEHRALHLKAWRRYLLSRQDRRDYAEWLKALREKLGELYRRYDQLDPGEKQRERERYLERKRAWFVHFVEGPGRVPWRVYKIGPASRWNNARLLASAVYDQGQVELGEALSCVKRSLSTSAVSERARFPLLAFIQRLARLPDKSPEGEPWSVRALRDSFCSS